MWWAQLLNSIVPFLESGGGSTNSYESIATVTSSGSTSSVTFSSIPSTYKHLQIRILSRSAYAATTDQIYMRLNSDSGTNYSWHYLKGDGASATASGYASDNIIYAATTPAASASANIFGVSIIDILDYGSTNKNKTVRILDGYDANGSGVVELRSSGWYSTSATTSILLANYMAGSNFASGSSFALYGVKG
jgi:hypothetical protein